MKKHQIEIASYYSVNQEEIDLVLKIKDMIKRTCKFFYSQHEKCYYFILDGLLFGFTDFNVSEVENVPIFWYENVNYKINKGIKSKQDTLIILENKTNQDPRYTLLEYEDLVEIYEKMKSTLNLKNFNI